MDLDKTLALKQLITRAWADPAFKNKFDKNPKEVFEEYGFSFDGRTPITIPEPPGHGELTLEDLKRAGFFENAAFDGPVRVKTTCCDITVAPSLFID